MYEVPTDTMYADRPIAEVQPNTSAPMSHVPQEQFAIPSGQWQQWLTPRVLVGVGGGLVLLVIGAIAMRSSAIPQSSIAIEPLKEPKVSMEKVNDFIINEASDNLEKLAFATDARIGADQLALENERAKDIVTWANGLLTNKDSSCNKSEYRKKCGLSAFILEQSERYRDAYRSRKWKTANEALFEVRSARIAWVGIADLPLDGDATATAIQNEAKAKIENERLSPNVIAAKDAEKGANKK